jgi:hypothetical protein
MASDQFSLGMADPAGKCGVSAFAILMQSCHFSRNCTIIDTLKTFNESIQTKLL